MKTTLRSGLLLLACLFAAVSHAQTDAPRQLVEAASTRMTERLIADREQIQSQDFYLEQLVDELLLPAVDHITMAKRVMGKYWRRASEEQQKTFVKAFKNKVIRTYAGAFKAFNGEKIEYQDSRLNPDGNRALVKSEIKRVGAANIRVDYKLYNRDDSWKVYDVIIEGVSLVKSFHDQVSLSIEQDGLAKAISALADEYKSDAPQVKLGGHAWGPYLGKQQPNYGLAADIVSAAFARAGYQLTIAFMPWNRVEEHIRTQQLDGSVASWRTPDRQTDTLFSKPYLHNRLVFIKRQDDPFYYQNPTQLNDLAGNKGYRLGIFENYSYGPEFDQIRDLFQIQRRDYCSQLFRDVANKELDLALVDHWVASSELSHKPNVSQHLVQAPGTLTRQSLHIALPASGERSQQLINAFNLGLQRLKQDGSYQQILDQHQFPQ